MKDGKVEFLYDEGDTIEAYESSSLQESEQVENETNTQINSFMDRLDHRGQIEIAHGFNELKIQHSFIFASNCIFNFIVLSLIDTSISNRFILHRV